MTIDQIVDFLLSIGMRPFVELSFMPTALASGSKTVFHYRGNVTPAAETDICGGWGHGCPSAYDASHVLTLTIP